MKNKNIVIITSNSIRHDYFRIKFSADERINVLRSYIEKPIDNFKNKSLSKLEQNHFLARKQSESDFFSEMISFLDDQSRPQVIEKNIINEQKYISDIRNLNPDLIITFGCGIIRKNFLEAFQNKILNVHLGISPYYLGAGTNFISLINSDFQCTGYTFMYMNEGIDTGEIIHQSRAKICHHDSVHQIGNRLIKVMTRDFIKLVVNFEKVKKIKPLKSKIESINCFNKDATKENTIKLYVNFAAGAVDNYLKQKDKKEKEYPIIQQSFMKEKI